MKASLAQLVFNRDMLLNIKFIADWETIRLRKQKDVDKIMRERKQPKGRP